MTVRPYRCLLTMDKDFHWHYRPSLDPLSARSLTTPCPSVRPCVLGLAADRCLESMVEGGCSEYVLLWYFHPGVGDCRPFVYGGCAGNQNRFPTRRECQKWCMKEKKGTGPIRLHVLGGKCFYIFTQLSLFLNVFPSSTLPK